ncbi:glutathione S-transferase [Rhodanobacter sp. L36]|uniref:glutathione S-transferase family protein n=1 Tax=Rhodanobacter sp. L36 TaxID=1747221 RepID=UPI00131A9616|nr:glutathione S-transferase [Rhodanobacter sp. L36]
MIVVHHLNNSRSQRILWLLEELGVPYELRCYQRDPKTMLAPLALRAVHPLGKSPVITEGDLTLAESGAIIEYLADHHGDGQLLAKAGTAERLRQTYWLHYAEGSAMPPLLLKLVFKRVESAPVPFFVKPVAKGIAHKVQNDFVDPQLKLHLDYLEGQLGASEWFAGDAFSVADIQLSFPLEAFAARGGLDEHYPRLSSFLQRIHARPAYERALQQGGEYKLG